MGNGDLTVLVTALLLVGYLVLDLDGAGTRLDHLARQQVGRFSVAETGIDVSNDRNDVRLEVVDFFLYRLLGTFIAGLARGIQFAEQAAQLAGISLAQEGIQLFDQIRHRGFLVHGLVGQRAKLRAQCCNHPTGEVQVALAGVTEVLLDSNQLLLADKAVPTPQGLGVLTAVSVVLRHILAHDRRRVPGDIQASPEAVLQAHAGSGLGVDVIPGAAVLLTQPGQFSKFILKCSHGSTSGYWVAGNLISWKRVSNRARSLWSRPG